MKWFCLTLACLSLVLGLIDCSPLNTFGDVEEKVLPVGRDPQPQPKYGPEQEPEQMTTLQRLLEHLAERIKGLQDTITSGSKEMKEQAQEKVSGVVAFVKSKFTGTADAETGSQHDVVAKELENVFMDSSIVGDLEDVEAIAAPDTVANPDTVADPHTVAHPDTVAYSDVAVEPKVVLASDAPADSDSVGSLDTVDVSDAESYADDSASVDNSNAEAVVNPEADADNVENADDESSSDTIAVNSSDTVANTDVVEAPESTDIQNRKRRGAHGAPIDTEVASGPCLEKRYRAQDHPGFSGFPASSGKFAKGISGLGGSCSHTQDGPVLIYIQSVGKLSFDSKDDNRVEDEDEDENY